MKTDLAPPLTALELVGGRPHCITEERMYTGSVHYTKLLFFLRVRHGRSSAVGMH